MRYCTAAHRARAKEWLIYQRLPKTSASSAVFVIHGTRRAHFDSRGSELRAGL